MVAGYPICTSDRSLSFLISLCSFRPPESFYSPLPFSPLTRHNNLNLCFRVNWPIAIICPLGFNSEEAVRTSESHPYHRVQVNPKGWGRNSFSVRKHFYIISNFASIFFLGKWIDLRDEHFKENMVCREIKIHLTNICKITLLVSQHI